MLHVLAFLFFFLFLPVRVAQTPFSSVWRSCMILTCFCLCQVEKLSIIPRSGGALGFTYTPPKTEDRALMFDNEIRGQLATLMGGRAAEELTCGHLST